MTDSRPLIAVVGAGACDEATAIVAEGVGRALAEAGAVLICGGLGGVMEAACRGAAVAGGTAIGVVPGPDRHAANEHVTLALATNMGHARNVILAQSADAMIAVGGSHGTLSEIAIALKLGKTVIGLGSWDVEGVRPAPDPAEAVRLALAAVTTR